MAQCTAPRNGHRTESGAANCPACSSHYVRSYNSNYSSSSNSPIRRNNSSGQSRAKSRWSSAESTILCAPLKIRTLTPVRKNVKKRSNLSDLKNVFLCESWDGRKDSAKELHDLLESKDVNVWFSEKDIFLGSSLLREINKGLAKSRFGIILITPTFLKRIKERESPTKNFLLF